MRPFAPRVAVATLLLLSALAGCTSVGSRRADVPLPGHASFDRSLLHYVRGELPAARAGLVEAIQADPGDLRAKELLQAVDREVGGAPSTLPPDVLPEGPMTPAAILLAVRGRNPEVRKTIQRVIGERAQLREADWALTPEFDIVSKIDPVSVVTTIGENLLVTVLQRHARMAAAEADMIAEVAGYARVRSDVATEAMRNYLFLLETQERADALDEEIATREEAVRVEGILVRYAVALPDGLLDRQAAVASARERRSQLIAQGVVARANLNRLMGLPAEAPLAVSRMWPAPAPPGDMAAAVEAARCHRPEIRLASLRAEEARDGAERIDADDYRIEPRVAIDAAPDPKNEHKTKAPRVSSALRLHFPLFLIPIQDAKDERERAVVRELELEVERVRGVVSVEAVEAWQEALKADRGLTAARKQIDAAKASLAAHRSAERWSATADRLTLLDAEASLDEARGRAAAFAYDHDRAILAVRRAMGEPPDDVEFVSGDGPRAAQLPVSGEAAAATNRAMWVWGKDLLDRAGEADFLLDFAEARGIGTLFLSASTARIAGGADAFRGFLARAHERGISVEALGGEAAWATPEGRASADAFVDAVIAFNAAGKERERFDAVHLDVEPHTLDAWKGAGRAAIVEGYVGLLQRACERTGKAALRLSADVPVQFAKVEYGEGTLSDAVATRTDAVAVMAYGPGPGALTRATQGQVEAAERAGKRVWVGLSADTKDLPPAAEGLPREMALEGLADEAFAAYRNWHSFSGIAVHDYARYRDLILGTKPH